MLEPETLSPAAKTTVSRIFDRKRRLLAFLFGHPAILSPATIALNDVGRPRPRPRRAERPIRVNENCLPLKTFKLLNI